MPAPLPPGHTRAATQPEPPRTADDILADLLALVAVYEAKQPAHRHIPAHLVREFITGERAR